MKIARKKSEDDKRSHSLSGKPGPNVSVKRSKEDMPK